MKIYWHHNSGFGDQWATVNFCLYVSMISGETVGLNHRTPEIGRMHREILDELDSPGQLALTSERHNTKANHQSLWTTPFFPTKRRWKFLEQHGPVAVQFDGHSSAAKKNPDTAELERVHAILAELLPGREIIPIGKHYSVAECVEIASKAFCFVGVCSGMSHLVHSVGTPMFLLEYRMALGPCHHGKAYWTCPGAAKLRDRLSRWKEFLREAGHVDGMVTCQPRQSRLRGPAGCSAHRPASEP